jgi:hypothetical protein
MQEIAFNSGLGFPHLKANLIKGIVTAQSSLSPQRCRFLVQAKPL